jgi:hypothetical protein
MLNAKRTAMALGCWMAITFTICVVGGVIAPTLPIPHRTLELLLPGFVWISATSFALGLVEVFLYGVYAAWLFVTLHNMFERRANRARPGNALKAA